MGLQNFLRDLLLPGKCVVCGKVSTWLCEKCENSLEPSIPECYVCRVIAGGYITHKKCKETHASITKSKAGYHSLDRSTKETSPSQISKEYSPTLPKTDTFYGLDRCFFGWYYNDTAKKLIKTLKYQYSYSIVDKINELLLERLNATGFLKELNNNDDNRNLHKLPPSPTEKITLLGSNNVRNDTNNDNTLMIPIPTSKSRLRERGFNQTELIAKAIAERFGFSYEPQLICKTNDDTHQARISKEKRLKNTQGKYFQNTGYFLKKYRRVGLPEPSISRVIIKRAIIVDDLITTGSTINEVARVVRKIFPNAEIWGIALFRGKRMKNKTKEEKN